MILPIIMQTSCITISKLPINLSLYSAAFPICYNNGYKQEDKDKDGPDIEE
jgi:hypothetical protein